MLITNDQVVLPKEVIINFSALSFMFLEQGSVGETCLSALDRGTPFIRALTISAKFKHPCALYFLATVLDIIHTNHTDAPKPKFFSELYEQAWPPLENSKGDSDACYAMGRSFFTFKGSLSIGHFKSEKSLEWHSMGQDLRNRYAMLRIRQAYKLVYTEPTLQEFLELARSGYPLAYIDAARYNGTFEERYNISILNEAAERGYPPALMYRGTLYESQARLPSPGVFLSCGACPGRS